MADISDKSAVCGKAYLGIDTSNYTTSAAIYFPESGGMINCKKLLPVEHNQKGLMQSKALFCHVKQLHEVVSDAFSQYYAMGGRIGDIKAVCVSAKPRNIQGSYMPVFLAGLSTAHSIAAALNIPCYESAHQIGHVLAALYSAKRLDLIHQRFLAFHVSGGTTEALIVTPSESAVIDCEIAAKTLDLNAGQVIDRVGVMMGMDFPCGAQLDAAAAAGSVKNTVKPTLKGCDCCLSGVQNICEKFYRETGSVNDTSRLAVEHIYAAIDGMTSKILQKYGDMPVVYAGGVMSNSIISQRLTKKGGIFAKPQFSSDNAAGIAVAASIIHEDLSGDKFGNR